MPNTGSSRKRTEETEGMKKKKKSNKIPRTRGHELLDSRDPCNGWKQTQPINIIIKIQITKGQGKVEANGKKYEVCI